MPGNGYRQKLARAAARRDRSRSPRREHVPDLSPVAAGSLLDWATGKLSSPGVRRQMTRRVREARQMKQPVHFMVAKLARIGGLFGLEKKRTPRLDSHC